MMRAILSLLLIFYVDLAFAKSEIKADWSVAEKRLKQAGLDPAFIKAMAEFYEPQDFQNVMELNVTLFMRKTDDHGVQVTEDAVKKVRDFSRENAESLARAEKEDGVPGSIVASLLFIESRYGKSPGRYHVMSVFAHLLQAERPDVIKHLKGDGAKRFTPKPSKQQLAKVAPRATKKVKWALSELKALQKMFRRDAKLAKELRGSFAGAFGLPQYLPSAYARWSKASSGTASADLTQIPDSIASVAFYLQKNGWKSARPKTRLRALMNYNNSRDYANAILDLAGRSTQEHGVASVAPKPD